MSDMQRFGRTGEGVDAVAGATNIRTPNVIDVNGLKALKKRNDMRQRYYRENKAYFEGRNPWLESREPRREPDNRIVVPLAKAAVEDMAGYAGMAGYRTVEIVNKFTDVDETQDIDAYVDRVREIEADNDAERVTSELYLEALVQGCAYEVFWFEPEAGVQFAKVPGHEIEVIYDGTLKNRVIGAVRYHGYDGYDLATVYEAEMSTTYKRKGDDWALYEQKLHPYKRVPVNVYKIGPGNKPLFEAEKGIIDALDKLISSSVNEVDRFNAVMALFPFKVDKEFVDKLRQMNVIDDLADFERWPEYLEKDLGKIAGFYPELADRMERLYHKSIKVPDFSDENFVGNSSGVAIAYKLLGLEFKASMIDTYFDMGIRGRYELIEQGITETAARDYQVEQYEIRIQNQRNLPVDDQAKIMAAQSLLGIVSRETVLRMLPNSIVEDVEKELQRLDEEPSLTLDSGEEVEDAGLEPTDETGVEAGGDVQRQALNGAQINSIVELAANVQSGVLPIETAVQIVMIAIPSITRDAATALFDDIAVSPQGVDDGTQDD